MQCIMQGVQELPVQGTVVQCIVQAAQKPPAPGAATQEPRQEIATPGSEHPVECRAEAASAVCAPGRVFPNSALGGNPYPLLTGMARGLPKPALA